MDTHRRSLLVAALLGAGASVILILSASHGHVRDMTIGDGLVYRYVAAHFNQPPESVHEVVTSRGTSLRYGRAGLPALIWLASGGRRSAMPYAQPIVMVLSGAAAAAATRALLEAKSWPLALLPFAAPGFSLALSGGFAEAPAAAIGLWAVVAAQRRRWALASVLLAIAVLTRENAGAILIGIVVWQRAWRQRRTFVTLIAALIPIGAWYAYVASKYGYIPVLDPYLRVKTSTVGVPVVAIARAIARSRPVQSAAAAVHAGLAVGGLMLWNASLLGAVAAACALQIFSAGPFSFHFVGEAARTGMFLQLFLILALAERRLGFSHSSSSSQTQ